MKDSSTGPSDDGDRPRAVFVSFSSANAKKALDLSKALEGRGVDCWISNRDVAPGENYQEAIVRAIKQSRAMVLVFSNAANRSEEIKKELSLASRHGIPVIATRIEDVEPSDAFAYELSTRQWIDAFDGWDNAIDALAGRIRQIAKGDTGAALEPLRVARRESSAVPNRIRWVAIVGLLLAAIAAAWFMLRPSQTAAHSMTVRLAGFRLLSADLPRAMNDTVDAEITAAFNADGVVGVSTASAPAAGAAPAYALGGTIQRDGPAIRVITRLTNERSGATLWTDTFNYDGKEVAKIPRHIAVDAGNVVRCGLFGASTYRKSLPDAVLGDYLQFCQGHWDPNLDDGRKALVPAQRVVAALPDFSWGWAGVAGAYWKVARGADSDRLAEEARASGRQAADRALAIDPRNSEALWIKSLLIDQHDWAGREDLLKRAIGAMRLDCGCEHHQYGEMLLSVGRVTEAVDQFRQADDMLALYVYTSASLANALVVAGRPAESRAPFDAARDLAPNADLADWLAVAEASGTGDLKALADPALAISPELRGALLTAYRATASADAGAKAEAVRALLAVPADKQNAVVARLLGQLGASREAFQLARRLIIDRKASPSVFWHPGMREALKDPEFPALAQQLGLIRYWKAAHTRPDACNGPATPAFCRMI